MTNETWAPFVNLQKETSSEETATGRTAQIVALVVVAAEEAEASVAVRAPGVIEEDSGVVYHLKRLREAFPVAVAA